MTTLYQKVGRKYIPVHDTIAANGLSNGSWLITVQDGLTKCRHTVEDEEGLKILAACLRWLEEWIMDALRESSAYHAGRGEILTPKEKRDYKAYEDVMRTKGMWLTKPSSRDIARAVCNKLRLKVSSTV